MAHFKMERVKCSACQSIPQDQTKHCHECKGRRFIDYMHALCEEDEQFDPMTGGWECVSCGSAGPY